MILAAKRLVKSPSGSKVILLHVLGIIAVFAVLNLSPYSYGEAVIANEYEVKAALIYKFMKYVEWPEDVFEKTDDHDHFHLCILGKDPVSEALESLGGESINGGRFEIFEYDEISDMGNCHMVFVGSSEGNRLMEILKALKNSGTLTVGDMKGFASKGGMINFYIEEDTVRFEINIDAVNNAGLKISSKVLRLARIIGNGE